MGHSVKRKEDPRFIRGAGEYIDDVNLPGQLWLDIVRSPYAHATIKGIDATEALKVPGVARGHHRRRPREGRPPLDADPRRRQADGAADRHGHVPEPGGRGGRRDDPVHRRRRRRGGHGRLRAAAGHRRPAQGARARRLRPAPGPRPRQAEQPHLALGVRRQGRQADAALAAAEVRIEEDIYIPRIHVASIETCGCVADWDAVRGQLTLHMTSQAPHAIRTVLALVSGLPGAEHPGQDPRHRRRVRRQGAGLPGLRPRGRRLVPDRRQAGQVDRGPLGEPPGRLVRPRLPHPRRARRDEGRQDHRRSRSRRSPTTATPTPRPTRRSSRPACSTSSPARTTSRTRSSRSTASTPTSRPAASPTAARSG